MTLARQVAYLLRLSRNLTRPIEEVVQLQEKKFLHMVRYAYSYIPYYHSKYRRCGIHPNDIKSISDITKLPLITKREILDTPLERMMPRHLDASNCFLAHTSGSTGTNMLIAYDSDSYAYERALTYRCNISSGQKLTDLMLAISSPTAAERSQSWFQSMGILRKHNVSVLDNPLNHIRLINRLRPDIVYGYPSSLWLIAQRVIKGAIPLNSPRIVMTTAEMLDSKMREVISTAFSAPVYDQFGCVEMGRTAWECPTHQGYHMNIDSFVFEFMRDGINASLGELGEIVYTNLYNHSMPLIRYAVGDIARATEEPCTCGRTLPLLTDIQGRKDDFVVRRNSPPVSPRLFALIMNYINGVMQYRIIQKSLDSLSVEIVPASNYDYNCEEQIRNAIESVIGEDIEVRFEILEELPIKEEGKMRKVISEVEFSWNDHL